MSTLNFRQQSTPLLAEAAQTFGALEASDSMSKTPGGYACLKASGADAGTFLQGQMTSDVLGLEKGQCQTSALCNPKGRVIAVTDIARVDDETYALILAHHLASTVITTLSRYILRAKVTFDLWPGQPLIVLRRNDSAPESGHCTLDGNGILSCRPGWLPDNEPSWELSNAVPGINVAGDDSSTDRSWALAHILLGLAPPIESTALEHIPQMLNLDSLGAVSMTKGCYTGQEIIARVHHRGAVKRRLRRFVVSAEGGIEPGDSVLNSTGAKAGMVVEVATDDNRNTGVLAVVKESDYGPDTVLFCNDLPLDHWPLP